MTPAKSEVTGMATVQDQLNTRASESAAGIGKVYDASINSQRQALLDAYTKNAADQAAQKEATTKAYQTGTYDVGVQNARNARNTTQFADVRNANTGSGSQHSLSLGNAAAKSLGTMAVGQQAAMAESDRRSALLNSAYQGQVQAAIADNDYKRAAALLDDYKNQRTWQEQQAQILASYGNFDPYATLYGQNAANGMRNVWMAQNPDVAYRTGAIDAEMYKNITGKYPAGYTPPSSGGGGWYYGPVKKKDDDGLNGPSGGSNELVFYNNGRTVTRAAPAGKITTINAPSTNPSGRSTNTTVQVVKP